MDVTITIDLWSNGDEILNNQKNESLINIKTSHFHFETLISDSSTKPSILITTKIGIWISFNLIDFWYYFFNKKYFIWNQAMIKYKIE